MSFGAQFFTGLKLNKVGTDASSVMPAKVLFSKDIPGFKSTDSGIHYYDIGVSWTRAQFVFVTMSGSDIYGTYEFRMPSIYAMKDDSNSSGTTLAVDIQAQDFDPQLASGGAVDLYLWVLGE